MLLGALNVWLGEHAWLVVAHLTVGALLWVSLVLLSRCWRVGAPAAAREAGARRKASAQPVTDGPDGSRSTSTPRRGRRVAGSTRARVIAGDYVALTKPRVISLLLVTTLATMFVADSSPGHRRDPADDDRRLPRGGRRRRDQPLHRARHRRAHGRTSRRPLPAGRIEPRAALWFGIALGVAAFALFALAVNMTAALLALAGLLGYVFVYTLWLKPITTQNIVIGGAAGAVPPLVGWAAAAGQLDPSAFYLFAIVFYWTPPHFWALALLIKDDYARTGIPMLPVVDGEAETRRQILLYGWLLLAITALPLVGGLFGAGLRGLAPRCSTGSSCGSACASTGAPTGARRRSCSTTRSPTWRCSSRRWRSTTS